MILPTMGAVKIMFYHSCDLRVFKNASNNTLFDMKLKAFKV
jgi:hypothetical protein